MDTHLIKLDQDHPGFRDPAYRVRRDAIAQLALAHRRGEPPPQVAYDADEQRVWSDVLDALAPLHAHYACKSFLAGWPKLGFVGDRIPQLSEVSARLKELTGFTYEPVAGLMSPREFMDRLADRTFLATQYMRHPSAPLYTPEPDVIHELVGHAPSLSDERYARINALFGEASAIADEATIEKLIRTYWFCLEFGLVREGAAVKAVGAGLLSSFGELGRFEQESTLLPFDLEHIAQTPFDPTQYQRLLFVAPSEDMLLTSLTDWLEHLGARGGQRPGPPWV